MKKYKSKLKFPEFIDQRGTLTVWENSELPFKPARTFIIAEVPKGQTRANHSVSCDIIITAIFGAVEIVLNHQETILLNKKTEGLLVEKHTYIELKNFTENAMLLVFAEKEFSETTYFN